MIRGSPYPFPSFEGGVRLSIGMVTNICGASLCSSGLLMCSRASCLGDPICSVWRCCSPEVMEASAPTKRKSPAKRRFTSPVSPGKMGTICKGVVTSNTKNATSWAVRVFEEWRRERNATTTGEQCWRSPMRIRLTTGSPAMDRKNHRFHDLTGVLTVNSIILHVTIC